MSPERVAYDALLAGGEEWLALSDALLAGLVHALNNRVAALSACSELAALGDVEMLKNGVLATEVERLQGLSALMALLPARERPAEALDLAAVLDDALLLHSHHPHMAAIEGRLASHGTTSPVRAPRWALARLLVLVVDAAKAAARDSRESRFELALSESHDAVQIRCRAPRSEMRYAASLAALCGGSLTADGECLVLALPSLQETRRRERQTRGSAG